MDVAKKTLECVSGSFDDQTVDSLRACDAYLGLPKLGNEIIFPYKGFQCKSALPQTPTCLWLLALTCTGTVEGALPPLESWHPAEMRFSGCMPFQMGLEVKSLGCNGIQTKEDWILSCQGSLMCPCGNERNESFPLRLKVTVLSNGFPPKKGIKERWKHWISSSRPVTGFSGLHILRSMSKQRT